MKKIVLLSLFSLILFGCNSDPKEIYSRQMRMESNPSGAAVIVNSFKFFNYPYYLGRLNATDISRICSSLIPSGSKPIDFDAI